MEHSELFAAPTFEEYAPAGHCEHAEAAECEKVPMPQREQDEARLDPAAVEYFPAAQLMQESLAAAPFPVANVPGPQKEQTVAP